MSTWTHVSGSVRIDSFVGLGVMTDKKVEEKIKEKLGKISTFENYIDPEEEYCTPTGSEGGIKYEYHVTAEDTGSLSRGAILITADLRSYGEEKQEITDIVEWLNKLNLPESEFDFSIRQGVVEIQTEGYFHGVAVFSQENKKFILKEI